MITDANYQTDLGILPQDLTHVLAQCASGEIKVFAVL